MSNITATSISKTFEDFSRPESIPRRWHWLRLLWSPLTACLLLAMIVRVWLIVHTNGVITGDEAEVSFQAEHILYGEYPIYYYGQPYMGSLQMYFIADIFLLTGPLVWALRIEPLLISLVIVWPHVAAHNRLASHFLNEIAATAFVTTQTKLGPHLSERREIYLFPYAVGCADYSYLKVQRKPFLCPQSLAVKRVIAYAHTLRWCLH